MALLAKIGFVRTRVVERTAPVDFTDPQVSGPRSSVLPLISELDSYSRLLPRYRSLKRSLSVVTPVFLSFKP